MTLPRAPVRELRTRAPSPWQLGGLTPRQLAQRVWAEVWDDDLLDRAAALSYYTVFAMFPALVFFASLLALLPTERLMDRLLAYLAPVMPADAASLLARTLDEVVRGASGGLVSIGAVGALWAASNGMSSVIAALNVAYDVTDPRPWWKRQLLALALTGVFYGFTLTALLVLVVGPRVMEELAAFAGLGALVTFAWQLLEWPVAALVVLTGIALIYVLGPAADQRWVWVTPGAVFALVVWLVTSGGLRAYVQVVGDYNATYGSIGAVILLLLWLYLSGLALLVGAEINAEIEGAAALRGAATAKRPGARVSVGGQNRKRTP